MASILSRAREILSESRERFVKFVSIYPMILYDDEFMIELCDMKEYELIKFLLKDELDDETLYPMFRSLCCHRAELSEILDLPKTLTFHNELDYMIQYDKVDDVVKFYNRWVGDNVNNNDLFGHEMKSIYATPAKFLAVIGRVTNDMNSFVKRHSLYLIENPNILEYLIEMGFTPGKEEFVRCLSCPMAFGVLYGGKRRLTCSITMPPKIPEEQIELMYVNGYTKFLPCTLELIHYTAKFGATILKEKVMRDA